MRPRSSSPRAGGSLGAPANLPVARGGTAAIGDANADGHPDVVVAGNPAGLSVFFGRGDGTFGAGVPVASAGAVLDRAGGRPQR